MSTAFRFKGSIDGYTVTVSPPYPYWVRISEGDPFGENNRVVSIPHTVFRSLLPVLKAAMDEIERDEAKKS